MTKEMEYNKSPSSLGLMLKAACKTSDPYALSVLATTGLTGSTIILRNQIIQEQKVRDFNRVCQWPVSEKAPVHPCFIHTMAFPVHLQLMLHRAFPFKLLGLVHLNNHIQQIRAVEVGEEVDIRCGFTQLEKHHKGWLFTIETHVYSGSTCIWRSQSGNLYRYSHGHFATPAHSSPTTPVMFNEMAKHWTLESSAGREYAAVSKDYNLIHLHPLAARLFGFKGHIAHGMYNKALCMSALSECLGSSFCFSTEFKKPVFLPAELKLCVSDHGQTKEFQLQSADSQRLHLQGSLTSQ